MINVPVVQVVRVPQSQVVAETAETPQLQVPDKMVDVPALFVVLVTQVQVVEKTVETPHLVSDVENDKVDDIVKKIPISDQDVYVTSGGRILRGSDKMKNCGVRDGSTVQVISRMRGGGKHKDKKGKEEKKKQVAQLDDGMCAIACEQMRQVMETLRTLADNSTGEEKRCVVEKVEELRKAMAGIRKQARGEESQRVAELEEGLKKLEEEMRPRSIDEQGVMRDSEEECEEKVARQGGGEIYGKGKGKGN